MLIRPRSRFRAKRAAILFLLIPPLKKCKIVECSLNRWLLLRASPRMIIIAPSLALLPLLLLLLLLMMMMTKIVMMMITGRHGGCFGRVPNNGSQLCPVQLAGRHGCA